MHYDGAVFSQDHYGEDTNLLSSLFTDDGIAFTFRNRLFVTHCSVLDTFKAWVHVELCTYANARWPEVTREPHKNSKHEGLLSDQESAEKLPKIIFCPLTVYIRDSKANRCHRNTHAHTVCHLVILLTVITIIITVTSTKHSNWPGISIWDKNNSSCKRTLIKRKRLFISWCKYDYLSKNVMVDICIDILGTEGTLKRHKSKHIIMYYFGFCKQLMHEHSMDSGVVVVFFTVLRWIKRWSE